jgi:glutathione S-transferase
VTLYGTEASTPSQAARLMLEHKQIDYDVVWLLPGFHPALVRAYGFRGWTVPALKLDGRKVQNSRQIARALEEYRPDPPLFPADPGRRRDVEEAERWGEEVLQNPPRQIFRWMAARRQAMRAQIAREVGLPLPGLVAATNAPVARLMARRAGADDNAVRAALAAMPSLLDHVDELLAQGVIGEEPNAADFQIVPSLRILINMEDTAPMVAGRPCEAWATRLLPEFPAQAPRHLPEQWLGSA